MATIRFADVAVGSSAFGREPLIARGGADSIPCDTRPVRIAFVQSLRGEYCVGFRLKFPPRSILVRRRSSLWSMYIYMNWNMFSLQHQY